MTDTAVAEPPELSPRSVGCLRYLYRKATTPDSRNALSSDAGKVHLEAGSYMVSWQSPDPHFSAFCGLASNADYGITIGLSPEPTNPKLVEDLVGGDYECQFSAKAGSAWTITFIRA